MPKLPRLNAQDAEKILFNAGFTLIRSKGSHRVYFKEDIRVVVPFHGVKILHPKIVKQLLKAIDTAENDDG